MMIIESGNVKGRKGKGAVEFHMLLIEGLCGGSVKTCQLSFLVGLIHETAICVLLF